MRPKDCLVRDDKMIPHPPSAVGLSCEEQARQRALAPRGQGGTAHGLAPLVGHHTGHIRGQTGRGSGATPRNSGGNARRAYKQRGAVVKGRGGLRPGTATGMFGQGPPKKGLTRTCLT